MSEQLTRNDFEKALRQAFSLGKKYWQEADSEYVQHNIKSALTQQAFEALVADTVEQARASQPALSTGQVLIAVDVPDDFYERYGKPLDAALSIAMYDHGKARIVQSALAQGDVVAWLDLSKLDAGGMAYATKFKVNDRQTALSAQREQPQGVVVPRELLEQIEQHYRDIGRMRAAFELRALLGQHTNNQANPEQQP